MRLRIPCLRLLLLATCALHLFSGHLHHRCVPIGATAHPHIERALHAREQGSAHSAAAPVDSFLTDGGPPAYCDAAVWQSGTRRRQLVPSREAAECGVGFECRLVRGSAVDSTFDTVGGALLAVLQAATLDGWQAHAYALSRALAPLGASSLAPAFFGFVVLLGAYTMGALFVAAVYHQSVVAAMVRATGAAATSGSHARAASSRRAQKLGRGVGWMRGWKPRWPATAVAAEEATLLPVTTVSSRGGGASGSEGESYSDDAGGQAGAAQAGWGVLARAKSIVESRTVTRLGVAAVLCNAALMCAPHVGELPARVRLRASLADAFDALFVGEACAKLALLGWGRYWAQGWRRLEGGLAALALMDWGVTLATEAAAANAWLEMALSHDAEEIGAIGLLGLAR